VIHRLAFEMKKKTLFALLLLLIVVGGLVATRLINQSKALRALAAYKVELRAKGEKLTFEEAGFPFPLEPNANLENFLALPYESRRHLHAVFRRPGWPR
jgi:hypothetical protein